MLFSVRLEFSTLLTPWSKTKLTNGMAYENTSNYIIKSGLFTFKTFLTPCSIVIRLHKMYVLSTMPKKCISFYLFSTWNSNYLACAIFLIPSYSDAYNIQFWNSWFCSIWAVNYACLWFSAAMTGSNSTSCWCWLSEFSSSAFGFSYRPIKSYSSMQLSRNIVSLNLWL